ncbi:MAG: DnaJ domain-containing protein [Nitrososphaeraceae archaeon]|jgi:DnaJ-class molecular chaperone|nr:DnaJ domain-containing protein [Nitrososphaeraceae archaeon]MDW0146700.1 DnaJ domain-containing protein [Nitrososphaeraceae archaeon]MDW0158458.1 DnaJ domain-containing protein [Nitrososphaeraceae archaeon]MDW3654943.1 DnaJ domain-containing protein [Nitrososphaeraceae archaeon]
MLSDDIMNYYAILGVSQYAKYREIKAAYRRLALKYHPDRNSSPVSENSIKIINAAFEVLSDKDKRRQYDEKLDNSIILHRKKEHTKSQTSSSNAGSSAAYSDSDHNNSHDNYDNTYLRKGKRNGLDVNSEGESSIRKTFGKTKGRYQISIEPSLCMAFGSCETLAPNVFEVDKNKMLNPKATVKSETGNDFESILNAAETCPTKAIILRDRYTGRQIYP